MNKKYQLHQIHLTDDEFNKVNAEGHNSVEKHKLHIEMSLSDKINSICKQAWDKGYYTHVANVLTADGLEGVFRTSNIGPDDNIEKISNMYSASVGDIIIDDNNKMFVVATLGFSELPQ
jgi:hypothetical protein|tara:strand:+ start:369 stop:725 length:357 start_codon:yes stop_codon:yes gene_type:complete